MDRWIAVRVNKVQHLWRVGVVDDATLEDLIFRARKVIGYPGGDTPVGDVSVFDQTPHDIVIAASQVHDVADLRAVVASDVQTYRDQCRQAAHQARLDDARRAVAQLSDADKATLRAELAAAASSTKKEAT